jgi:hypothetical protein
VDAEKVFDLFILSETKNISSMEVHYTERFLAWLRMTKGTYPQPVKVLDMLDVEELTAG